MGSDTSPLESFSHLWIGQKNDFVLLKVDGFDKTSTERCLIYNIKAHSTLVLEDDRLAQIIMNKMKAAGVPVVLHDELPRAENELERTINEMLESGKTPPEINAIISAHKATENKA